MHFKFPSVIFLRPCVFEGLRRGKQVLSVKTLLKMWRLVSICLSKSRIRCNQNENCVITNNPSMSSNCMPFYSECANMNVLTIISPRCSLRSRVISIFCYGAIFEYAEDRTRNVYKIFSHFQLMKDSDTGA